jgi:hypothetical protein
MNNPFSRLKHFVQSERDYDSQENHATECLAACLVFSPKIRGAFIQFLCEGDVKLKVADESKIEVITQQTIEGGYIDLILELQGAFTVVVEVKVKAPENCQHHRNQLTAYRMWLDSNNKSGGYLFTLVRNPDSTFHPQECGANARRSWWDLYKYFQKLLRLGDLSDVEISLIENLCEYLESEGIVSIYQTKDLLSYADGLKAQKAITAIFNQVASRLQADKFESEFVEGKKDSWPSLRIQHPDWLKIFGAGKNKKITLWFTVPPIWGADCHDFDWNIELWMQEDGNDWEFTKPKLAKWFAFLKAKNFDWNVSETWKRDHANMPANEIKFLPKRIFAYKGDREKESQIILNQSQPQNEDALIDLLVNRTKQYAEVVSSLGKKD